MKNFISPQIENFDIEKYLAERNIEFYSHVKNVSLNWIGLNCPFCRDDPSWHLGISPTNSIKCFRCGIKGTILKLIMKIESCGLEKAVSIVDKNKSFKSLQERLDFQPAQKIDTSKFTSMLLKPHKRYLEKRRFDPDYIFQKYGLMCCISGKFRYRIIAPIYQRNQIVNFVARDVSSLAEQKYLYPKMSDSIIPKGNLLYNQKPTDIAVIVEGITDVWRVGDGCFALLGKVASHWQVSEIAKIKKPFIMLDSDAVENAKKLVFDVSSINPNVEMIELNQGDPCDLPEDDIKHLRQQVFGRV